MPAEHIVAALRLMESGSGVIMLGRTSAERDKLICDVKLGSTREILVVKGSAFPRVTIRPKYGLPGFIEFRVVTERDGEIESPTVADYSEMLSALDSRDYRYEPPPRIASGVSKVFWPSELGSSIAEVPYEFWRKSSHLYAPTGPLPRYIVRDAKGQMVAPTTPPKPPRPADVFDLLAGDIEII